MAAEASACGRNAVVFALTEAIQVLERTPTVVRSMLAGLGDCWIRGDYGPDTFCPFDVVGHLIHGEKVDWLVRTRLILEKGTSQPFAKYDRYAQFEASRGRSLVQLLDEFQQLRSANLAALGALRLTPEDLVKRGTHPALGEVTLENLLATWVAHDLNHIAQVAKAMATQYQQAVGPWREYLGVLKSPVTRMDADGAARRRAAQAGREPGG
jgi:DinB superfamily